MGCEIAASKVAATHSSPNMPFHRSRIAPSTASARSGATQNGTVETACEDGDGDPSVEVSCDSFVSVDIHSPALISASLARSTYPQSHSLSAVHAA